MTVLNQIIERYQRYGWSEPVGEWGVIQSAYRQELRDALDTGDVDALDTVLSVMFRGKLAYGLTSAPEDLEKMLPQQLTWRLALWAKVIDVPDIERLAATDAGDPIVIHATALGGNVVPIMPDVMRFDSYARRIVNVLPSGVVLEIGSGYGGVALQLLRSSTDIQIVLCDIPETLYLAYYWLSKSTERSVAWWDDDPAADVVLLPCGELWGSGIDPDLVFSAHSLSGMDSETIDGYMGWLGMTNARYFYHDDVAETVEGVWMTSVFPEVLIGDIEPPEGFVEQWRENTPWMGLSDRFLEMFYERTP